MIASSFDNKALGRDVPAEATTVTVAIDGSIAGLIVLADSVRTDAGAALDALRQAGIRRIVLASGDRAAIAMRIGTQLGVDESLGDLTPADKRAVVAREAAAGPVVMIGDGVLSCCRSG